MTQTRICSFNAVSGKDARVLILGSMPGVASLEADQYYAHPRNAFWRIMGDLIGAGPDKPYDERLKILKSKKIALWDVLQSCERAGSLDTAIKDEHPNNLPGFLENHLGITHIFLNGGKAEASFKRHFKEILDGLETTRLPSTSPANAGVSFAKKCQAWSNILKV